MSEQLGETQLSIKKSSRLLGLTLVSVIKDNNGKIPPAFVKDYASVCTFEFAKVGESCRVCIMTTSTGSKFIGHSFILDPLNDVEEIGNGIAKENCTEQLWSFLGGFATLLDY